MGEEDYMFLPPLKQIIRKHRHCILKIIETRAMSVMWIVLNSSIFFPSPSLRHSKT